MKLTFTETERAWLYRILSNLLTIAQDAEDTPWAHKTYRLRNKLAPNAAVCWLKKDERSVLLALCERRVRDLNDRGGLSEELVMLGGIMEKMSS